MTPAISKTKLTLISAAGQLFAMHGLDGVSVRTIAEKAGVNIAAINYHFGGKEKLYTEALRFAILHGVGMRPADFLKKPNCLETPEGIAHVIYEIVQGWFISYLSPEQPFWFGQLIARSLLDPTPSLREVVEEIFRPDHEALCTLVAHAKPGMSELDIRLWALSVTGQLALYDFCRVPILMILEKESYDEAFLKAASDHVARLMIAALELPQPTEGYGTAGATSISKE